MIDGCYEFGRKSTDKFYVPFEELPSKASLRAYMRKEGLMIRMGAPGMMASLISVGSLDWS
jgi:hypothetical protein